MTQMVMRSAAILVVPPERETPVEQRCDDDEYDPADGKNGDIRQTKHAIKKVC